MNAKIANRNLRTRKHRRDRRFNSAIQRTHARAREVSIIDRPFTLRWFDLDA